MPYSESDILNESRESSPAWRAGIHFWTREHPRCGTPHRMTFDHGVNPREPQMNAIDRGLMRHENGCSFGTGFRTVLKIRLKPVSFIVLRFTGEENIRRTLCLSRARDACSASSKTARGCQDLKIRNNFSHTTGAVPSSEF